MKPADIPVCPDCAQVHLGRCGGMRYRDRLLSVRPDANATPTQGRHQYYDDDVVRDQFQTNLSRDERREDLLDRTDGFSYAETDAKGQVWGRDPKTHERRVLTPTEVDRTYLSRGTPADPSEMRT